MNTQNKELLLKDLCTKLPYGVIVQDRNGTHVLTPGNTELDTEYIKPYLRPLSSMTEEEFKEYHSMLIDVDNSGLMNQGLITKIVDWLDEKMFDHRNLIPKGLALEASEGMYKTE